LAFELSVAFLGACGLLGAFLIPGRSLVFDAARRQFRTIAQSPIGWTTIRVWSFDQIEAIEIDRGRWFENRGWDVVIRLPGHRRTVVVRRTDDPLKAEATIARLRTYLAR
jgi:hypothetical protein